jgi:hypothetical protein
VPIKAFLDEVERLRDVCLRLDSLGEEHPPMADQLSLISGNIRNSATLLEVVVTIKFRNPLDGDYSGK